MTLADSVKKQFEKNTSYAQPEHAVNQAESLNALSRDLYTDTSRFIYELLQNADDSGNSENQVNIGIQFFDEVLVVAHTGKPFDERDLRGLCGVNDGAKKRAADKTGFKGIGFKSVFARSNKVIVYSASEYFRFDAWYSFDWRWKESQELWEQQNERNFSFPWQIIPIVTQPEEVPDAIRQFIEANEYTVATILYLDDAEAIQSSVQDLAETPEMFLFLKHVTGLSFKMGVDQKVTFSPGEMEGETALMVNDKIHSRWLKHSVLLNIPLSVRQSLITETHVNIPDKLKEATQAELTLAAKLGEKGLTKLDSSLKPLYAYLPTEETKFSLPVLVNAGFLTAANREYLHENVRWNQWLFGSIAKELFNWIAELVKSSWQYQAYGLLPTFSSSQDALSKAFNEEFYNILKNFPFVINTDNVLLKATEALVDFTFLSDKPFVGREIVKAYCAAKAGQDFADNPFIPNTGYGVALTKLGVFLFDWKQVPELLINSGLCENLRIQHNIELIKHLYEQCTRDKPKLKTEELKSWPFIYSQKKTLCQPKMLYFPEDDDEHWNDEASELDFVHEEIQAWLQDKSKLMQWFGELGIEEKTDLAYVKNTIAPNAAEHCDITNAIATIRQLYSLFERGELPNLWDQLKHLKLLTKEGSLLSATECYFSDVYKPRLPLEGVLEKDVFISEDYLPDQTRVDDWRGFLKRIGVKDGIEDIIIKDRTSKCELIKNGFVKEYFDAEDKKFRPAVSTFIAEEYSDFLSLRLIHETCRHKLAYEFWVDVIGTKSVEELERPTWAHWGYEGRQGWTKGDSVPNYLSWYIKNKPCIPTTTGTCHPCQEVFLNNEEQSTLLGSYLPVFDGSKLSDNWRAFFQFKTNLELADHLQLLTAITNDLNDEGKLKQENRTRVSKIYSILLDACENWSNEDRQQVKDWAVDTKLPTEDNSLVACNDLRFYADGNNNIFQGAFVFIRWENAQKQHPQSETLLNLLGVTVMYQSQFEIVTQEKRTGESLYSRVKDRIPYWAKRREKEVQSGYEQMLYELSEKLEQLHIFTAEQLKIKYDEQFEKTVNVHLLETEIYVREDWEKELIMKDLLPALIRYFGAKGHEQDLSFLLRAEIDEIQEWFGLEEIELPPLEQSSDQSDQKTQAEEGTNTSSKKKMEHIDYTKFWAQSKERSTKWMDGLHKSPSELLLRGLANQGSSCSRSIYHFTHIENAVRILQEGSIKSRNSASFKDSAGQGIIGQTDEAKKKFARFYFRPHTPTQYYVENLGQGSKTIDNLGEEAVCPVPVFFKIPIMQALEGNKWQVSLGSMAVPDMKFGNEHEIIEQFDFEGAYGSMQDLGYQRFKIASHQEFLVLDELQLEGLDLELVVQDDNAKLTLEELLPKESPYLSRINVDDSVYLNGNARVGIHREEGALEARVPAGREGQLILQVKGSPLWLRAMGSDLNTDQTEAITTYTDSSNLILQGEHFKDVSLAIYFAYNGQTWLHYAQNHNGEFSDEYIKKAIQEALSKSAEEGLIFLNLLSTHPVIAHWYKKAIGGPDKLSLREHTLNVINNYIQFFKGCQGLFKEEKTFLLFLALHDIGKPRAILLESKTKQHEYSLAIIDDLKEYLPVDAQDLKLMKGLINGDPIGQYLNPIHNSTLKETTRTIEEMASQMGLTASDLWPSLMIYYQCDAGGYNSLKNKLFVTDDSANPTWSNESNRWLFQFEQEEKIKGLELLYGS